MASVLHSGVSGIDLSDFGHAPNGGTSPPIWRCTQISPTTSNVNQIIADAETYDIRLFMNFAGARGNWTNSVGGFNIYDPAAYESQVRRFENNANVAAAIASRRIINFTVDEPNIPSFGGSIPKSASNAMGLLHKSIWPGCLTAMRMNGTNMTPPPSGGWTGVDYGWTQLNRGFSTGGLTARQYFDNQKALLLAVNCGMVHAINWINGGDGRLWDYLNNGTSSGRIAGDNGSPFWLCSPAEIREAVDACYDDPDGIGFLGYTFCSSSFVQNFLVYQNRSDFVAARNYQLNKFATRPTFNGFRAAKGVPGQPPAGTGDGIDHFFPASVTTRVTTTSGTYVDVPGAYIDSTNLTPGKRHLVVVSGEIDWASTTANASVRVVSGSTLLRRSEASWRYNSTSSKMPYLYWGVFTTVAGENIQLQFKSGNGASVVGANRCTVFAMNIADDLQQNVDYAFAESTASTTLSTSYQDGASVTFTPQTAGDNWLVLTSAHYTTPPLTQGVFSGLRRGGEDVSIDPEVRVEGKSASDLYLLQTMKALTLGANSNTFAEQSINPVLGGVRNGSAVFAMRLNRFARHTFFYDSGDLDFSATNFATNVATVGITPTILGDVWALGSFGTLSEVVGSTVRARLQVDNADLPTGQTAAASPLAERLDPSDVQPVMLLAANDMTAALHTFDLDASVSTAAAAQRGGRNRCLVAITTRLAATVGAPTLVRRSADTLGTRSGTRKVS